MLSCSTGESGTGKDVQKVKDATKIFKEKKSSCKHHSHHGYSGSR
ncbi:MAG: hypothetical protein JJW00_03475 [Sulfurimonas sp.]|nr:hypothetical protein [Sulfurimonas sp.]